MDMEIKIIERPVIHKYGMVKGEHKVKFLHKKCLYCGCDTFSINIETITDISLRTFAKTRNKIIHIRCLGIKPSGYTCNFHQELDIEKFEIVVDKNKNYVLSDENVSNIMKIFVEKRGNRLI